ncbi:ParB N-terminal domain-containing protein [Pantoea sp. PNT02]|uniref:ParB/RepB/Spo0J family partition protein n=1 Tax=Pantoea sp. PNT02 TaxID=2769261 RepID=UPI001787340B|nr:ParB N-terminal domain-containing protein [Pantoea sp. PNT02]MBD9642903.1 ParB N-terminal domain-containing protein [Pantoea sp. PNT02]
MSTLERLYKNKAESGKNITTRKTFLVGVDELYIEPGYNVRDIDPTHVEEFRDAFIAGEHVPPLTVQVTEKGVKVIDGHHRWHGAKLAQEAGHEIRLECKDFTGSEAERIAFMVTSSQGRALEPLERAAAYQRLRNQGWEPAEIAKKVKRSVADVEHHLALLTVGDGLIEMVKTGEVAATTAVAMVREHGAKAETVAKTQLAKAKADGKKKLTRSAAMPQFSAAKLRQLIELIAKNCEAELSDDTGAINLDFESGLQALEVMQIISEAKAHFGIGAAADDFGMHETKLPLAADEITEQSGVEVLACAVAAFGDKPSYTHAESKYAHTWAADSVSNPEFLIIPAETVDKAVSFISKHVAREEITDWVSEKYRGDPQLDEVIERFSDVIYETDTPPNVILALLDDINIECGYNIRELRKEITNRLSHIAIHDMREVE